MAEIIRMPRMSDTMEEGNIVEWLKEVGDKVEPGDILAEVETDKATMELESYYEGTLLYIGIEKGPVPVDGILAVIGEEGEDYQAALDSESKQEPASKEEKTDTKPDLPESNAVAESDSDSSGETAPVSQSSSESSRIIASPLAKKMASTSGIEIAKVQGTGEGGRIVKRDIEKFLSEKPTPAPEAAPIVQYSDFEYGVHPLSQMRKTIAKRLSASKYGSPHFYLTIEINMDRAVDARKDINAHSETRISFNDFVIKACAAALRKHPAINASWKDDHILYHKEIHIGVAVAIDEGLLVPVIKNTDLKSMSMINAEVRELAGRAKNKKLQLEEMQGNTFTVSNLGMFGIEEFTAIINPPDACILAIGAIIKKPIVDAAGSIRAGNMMKVTLSCDHRVVDGAKGAEFLQTLKLMLENPVMILV